MQPHHPTRGNRTTRTHGRPMPNTPKHGVPAGEGEDFIYDPHGVCEWETDPVDWANCGPMFQGMRDDPEQMKLPDFGRAFHPTAKEWTSPEASGYVGGDNAYIAFGDEPANPTNPLGT
jgi:hypothetical protein